MKNSIISMLFLFLLLPFLIQAEDLQLKIVNTTEDLPENFCTIWKKGDYLVSDGEYLVLLGGSARPIKDILNFPASNAMGSIISFAVEHPENAILKFLEEVGLKLKKDSYISVEVLGKKSLFPVLQKQAKGGQLEKATLPYALTNPVFIDVDGNGNFDSPLPEKIKLASDIPESKSNERGN